MPRCLLPLVLLTALAQTPDWRAQANALKAKGDAPAALAAFEKALEADPRSPQLLDETGFLLAVLGRRAEAIPRFQYALAIDPNFAPAHFHLAVAHWLDKNPNAAIPALQRAVQLAPKNAEYRARLADMFAETGRDPDALREALAAVQLAPRPDLWNRIGLLHQKSGHLELARDAFAKAVSLNPSDPEFKNNLGFVFVDLGLAPQALAQFRQILRAHPDNLRAQINIGYALLHSGDHDAALAHFQSLAHSHPAHPVIRYDLGLALKHKDRIDDAIREFRAALALDPNMAEAHYTLGITAWQNGDFDETAAAMRAAIAILPNYAEAHYMLGTALKQKGDLAEAAAALETAIQLDPSSPGPFNTLAQIRQSQGNKEEARKLFALAAAAKKKLEAAQSKRLGAMGPATR